MNSLFLLSATRIAQMIKTGEISSAEAVEAHIKRIEEVNPVLNAVVKDRFEEARKEAKQADGHLLSTPPEKLPPFHGVPCTIKECFALTGMPNTSGLVSRAGYLAPEDATAVSRIRASGAIPMGVTNVSELCMWMETYNCVYGRTRNPYDPRRIVGGSSGGEGAIVGAGASPFGLGSDIGGSIRMPAFFNGVFGHKGTGGLIPNTGQFPISQNQALRYLCTGPLCRRAEDLWPLVKILAGPDGKDKRATKANLGDPDGVSVKELNVYVIKSNGLIDVSEDLLEAQEECAKALEKLGARVKETRIKGLKESLNIWSSSMEGAAGYSYEELLGAGREVKPYAELLKWALKSSPYTLPSIGLTIIERLQKRVPWRISRYIAEGRRLRGELMELMDKNGVILYPPYPEPAPLHNLPLLVPFKWVYTAIFNIMEFPVTQVPLGLNGQNLPLGVQVVSTHGNDHVTVRLAVELEKIFGGWVPPDGTMIDQFRESEPA